MAKNILRALAMSGILSVAAAGSAASAATTITTTYDFTTSAAKSVDQVSSLTAKTFTSAAQKDGSTISMRVTAWHAIDRTTSTNIDDIRSASLGYWVGGLGVTDTTSGESTSDNTHQIDNISGVDFLMLQFSQDVSLSALTRNMFGLTGYGSHDDATYWADTAHAIGTASNWSSAISLAGKTVDESLWTAVGGDANGASTIFSSNKTASVWLVGADFLNRNDGFKLAALSVNVVSYAPEPASWAMMIVGFGAVGTAMRRRKALAPSAA